jgi:demethylmenaquinone methyltransferase/2-methoxy-6-polyprenyl-1,4-benzoquinol methylase
MFARIAERYDLMNRLMTLGMDIHWRRFLVKTADLPVNGRLLDVGTGTGDIAAEALRVNPSVKVTGADLTLEMMKKGMKKPELKKVGWCCADALELPFMENIFDSVTSGYLVRNVTDARKVFEEQMRVVKPGGKVLCLDTSPAPDNFLRPFILFHLKVVIPFLGYLVARDSTAYTYLPESTQAFMEPEVLASLMRDVGLKDVSYRKFMFGTMAVHWGTRPKERKT